jgi:hypothetical protein
MTGSTLFYDFGTYSAIGSGTQNMDTTYTPGYSFSATMLVTFQDTTTQTVSITPGLQLYSPTVVTKGGTLTTSGTRSIRTFTAGGNFKLIYPLQIQLTYLVVGAGGGAGGYVGAGGGGGVVTTGTTAFYSASSPSYVTTNITIGTGGIGQIGTASPEATPGSASSFGSIVTSAGGGKGDAVDYPTGRGGSSGAFTGGLWNAAGANSGGGAGAGQNGVDATAVLAGNGGNGVQSSISGTATYYGGGGGGGYYTGGPGTGGLGGGANGNPFYNPLTRLNGTANTGGGGGGATGGGTAEGGNGGTGIVIFSYSTNYSKNPDLTPFKPRSPVGRSDYYKHPGRGMPRYMTEWMDSLNV